MYFLNLSYQDVKIESMVKRLYKAMVTTGNGQVLGSTMLYDVEQEALEAGGELLRLYNQKKPSHEAVELVGYMSLVSIETLKAGLMGSVSIFSQPMGQDVVPVYVKINDGLVTRPISGKA